MRKLRECLICLLILAGCSQPESTAGSDAEGESIAEIAPAAGGRADGVNTGAAPAPAPGSTPGRSIGPERNPYFGDLHVHTRYSFDAFVFGNRTTPDDAYAFAKGEAIPHPAGFPMRIGQPLDFQAVTDHAAYLGMLLEMSDPNTPAGAHPDAEYIRNVDTAEGRTAAFQYMAGYFRGTKDGSDLLDIQVVRSAWESIIESAERHNDPGTFTTFIGYEYTSSGSQRENLHRNVIFRGSDAATLPFSRLDSTNPEKLWAWMDELRGRGIESLAIPHNSNGSNGIMFEMTNWVGDPIDADYARMRMRNEPLVEITQVKGTSETHPLLSPNDEWADFEIMPFRVATNLPSEPAGGYVRDAYLRGLMLESSIGANPYKFGAAGATDTHVSAGAFDEFDYWSKVGLVDYTGRLRGSVPVSDVEPRYASNLGFATWGASGLTGVWAESNTREAIYDAFRRKETFATSGPRIQVRFFAGYDLTQDIEVTALYQSATPMGGDLLLTEGQPPQFLVWAARDPRGTPLQRMQVVKGWLEAGESRERVFDVACSDDGKVDPATHRCPDNGATVDLDDCSLSTGSGSSELRTIWQDPSFDPDAAAFYYVRVLENPSCRWSTWDALRANVAPREGLAATIQERAWSSPIWYTP